MDLIDEEDKEVRLSDHRKDAELRRFVDAKRFEEFQEALKSILIEASGPEIAAFEQELVLRSKEFDVDILKDFVFRSMAEGRVEKHIADHIYDLLVDYSIEEHW